MTATSSLTSRPPAPVPAWPTSPTAGGRCRWWTSTSAPAARPAPSRASATAPSSTRGWTSGGTTAAAASWPAPPGSWSATSCVSRKPSATDGAACCSRATAAWVHTATARPSPATPSPAGRFWRWSASIRSAPGTSAWPTSRTTSAVSTPDGRPTGLTRRCICAGCSSACSARSCVSTAPPVRAVGSRGTMTRRRAAPRGAGCGCATPCCPMCTVPRANTTRLACRWCAASS
ncbi:MAG: hypothetical protein BWZ02_03202 [Lentisphaerae bacterium ADurb.BinA184]|nr:MAG: hypothetical protein BWZ02_03202 [Lentisphaerae bacterium ADurb.BinA184]